MYARFVIPSACDKRVKIYDAIVKTLFRLHRCHQSVAYRTGGCRLYMTSRRSMGLLTQGETLTWPEIQEYTQHVREHGVAQFINQYHKTKYLVKRDLLWGDEMETMITKFNHTQKRVRLSLRNCDVVAALQRHDRSYPHRRVGVWMMEFSAYQVESTPALPYGGSLAQLCRVESNMRKRREQIQSFLEPDEVALNMTAFPRLGCADFTYPPYRVRFSPTVWRSMFLPDEFVCSCHPRYGYVARHLPLRRGDKMHINIPIFKDENTPDPFIEDLSQYGDDGSCQAGSRPDHIYMDTGGFASGNCCLQVTFQTRDVDEARVLYDQMIPMCPILMALSAAAPVFRGYLADVDSRWSALSQGLDDRTREERGETPLTTGRIMTRSRYNHAHLYISHQGDGYNDVDVEYDENIYIQLQQNGVDRLLARHVAHLFTRDAISLFRNTIYVDDLNSTEHFENINSTYWQSLRFKLPPPGTDIGWRVEVRPMDIQVTDFENAAYALFVILLSRAIIEYDLNLIIPISKVDENMKRCQVRDAIFNELFYFRRPITPEVMTYTQNSEFLGDYSIDDVGLMTIDEIINGKAPEHPGLMYFIRRYIYSRDADIYTKRTALNYMDFISKRASGEIKTTANAIRQFFTDHPLYRQDSVVSARMNYDLLMKLAQESGVYADSNATILRA